MTVQYRPCRIGDWIVLIVPWSIPYKSRNRALLCRHFPHAPPIAAVWRIPKADNLCSRRFMNRQCDFTLRLGKTGKRIHQQQYMLSLILKYSAMLVCQHGAVHTPQRRVVRRARQPLPLWITLLSQDVFDELLHLTTLSPISPTTVTSALV